MEERLKSDSLFTDIMMNATDIDDELMDNIMLVSSIVDGLYSDKNKQSQV